MALALPDRPTLRPACSKHPGSRILLDGFTVARWSDAHRRPRYRCVPAPGTKGHSFTLALAVRQPTDAHPDAGRACPNCDHLFERHEGIRCGRGFVFGHQEIGRLFIKLGEGLSLRHASCELREHVLKTSNRKTGERQFKRIHRGDTSRQANLAVNYLDAYALGVLTELMPGSWPRVLILDSTTLMATGYRPPSAAEIADGASPDAERLVRNLKAGTILVAMDGTPHKTVPVLLQVQGGKDTESWKAFFSTLSGAPDWVIADLDSAIARAVRETWPKAILYHSRHHLEELMRKRALEDGVAERVRLEEPVQLTRAVAWTGGTERRWGDHPLHAAMKVAQRGPEEWAAFKDAIAQHIPPDRLALRSWVATNELLIARQWRIAREHGPIPLTTGPLEGKIAEWLAPIKRRAGRWQNARRLNLVLGLITLKGRGIAREARYAKLVRAQFDHCANASHLPTDNALPVETYRGKTRQVSWWRTWQDRDEASIPRLVFESDRRSRRRAADEHLEWARERMRRLYEAEADLRQLHGLPMPPSGRPKNPRPRIKTPTTGRFLHEFEDYLLEWDWDFNADLDPMTIRAGSHERVAWRCLLDENHVWETALVDRIYHGSFCPFHMGNRVHPSESLAAFYPDLALEWHPTKNDKHADEVTRASGYDAHWICEFGHEWQAVVYQRTLSKTQCPECVRLAQPAKARAAAERRRQTQHERAEEQISALPPAS